MTILGSPLYLLELNSSNPDNKYMQRLVITSKLKLQTNFSGEQLKWWNLEKESNRFYNQLEKVPFNFMFITSLDWLLIPLSMY